MRDVSLRSMVQCMRSFALATLLLPVALSAQSRSTLFHDVRLFDGTRVAQHRDVLVRDGKIASVGGSIAVITAAHKRGKLAVVHVGDLAGARGSIAAGADGLMHLFVDRDPDPEFGRFVAAARPQAGTRAFVVPTLVVLKGVTGSAGGAPLVTDPRTAPYLTKAEATALKQSFGLRPGVPMSYAAAEKSVKQLMAAGVPILAGTDAGNPGTSHGAALHRELELLVLAGMTPTQALASATSVPAKAFRLTDRGRIATGLRADLLLVNGDPTADITATRDIAGIWKDGVRADRAAYAKAIAAAAAQASVTPAGAADGLVSDFESGKTDVRFGSGWVVSTDAIAGGKSTGEMAVVDGGANGSAKSLAVTGTISGALPYAWSGAMFNPGTTPMQPVNLSSKREITFWTKGDGKTYRAMVFAESKGSAPQVQTFVAGPEWTQVTLPISGFGGIDGHDIMALLFAGGPQAGTFSFRVDDVRFR
jgi:hypothetical protein